MRLITRRTLEDFARQHADAAQALADWCAQIEAARWCSPIEMARSMPGAEHLGQDRVKFRIMGNRYRIVASVRFAERDGPLNGIVVVHFFGSHAEYDKVDAMDVTLPAARTRSRS